MTSCDRAEQGFTTLSLLRPKHNVQDNVPLPLFHAAMNFVLTSPCQLPCRAPWRLAVYYLQSRDERILPLLQAQLRFFEGQKLISAGYKLDGTALADYSNIAFQSPVWCLFKVRMLPTHLPIIAFQAFVWCLVQARKFIVTFQ